jgi:hypothetical protein
MCVSQLVLGGFAAQNIPQTPYPELTDIKDYGVNIHEQ